MSISSYSGSLRERWRLVSTKSAYGNSRLRIFVEPFHVRMRWGQVEVEVVLLDILAMVPLTIGEPKKAFLDDRISSIKECERKAQSLLLVGEAG